MLPAQNKTRCKAGKTAKGQGRKDKRLFAKLLYVRGTEMRVNSQLKLLTFMWRFP